MNNKYINVLLFVWIICLILFWGSFRDETFCFFDLYCQLIYAYIISAIQVSILAYYIHRKQTVVLIANYLLSVLLLLFYWNGLFILPIFFLLL